MSLECTAVGNYRVLSSWWGDLSPHLIAQFYEVDHKGNRVMSELGGTTTVCAPLTDANFEVTLGWQSQFENLTAVNPSNTMVNMLQSGQLNSLVDLAGKVTGQSTKEASSVLKEFEGRTGITKLNSTQTFLSMPPVRVPVTAIFRAWRDPIGEVDAPFNQLMRWVLPQKLSSDAGQFNDAYKYLNGDKSQGALRTGINVLLPSFAPKFIAIEYKKHVFAPMVVESVSYPINSPINRFGDFTELLVAMSVCSLAALDIEDWQAIREYK